jgi:hypothetical protein
VPPPTNNGYKIKALKIIVAITVLNARNEENQIEIHDGM